MSYPATDQAAVYTFDIGNQLTSIANKVLPSTNIATYAYTDFDAVGNREEMQRTYLNGSAATTNYTYNDLYELSGTSGVQSHSYAYDKVGNRTTVDSVNYTDNTRNQYTGIGGVTYTNSTNGNITSDGTSTFGYDAENRLISFDTTGSANDATYAYDALGRRVKKTVNSIATYFVYDGDDIIADYSSAGTLLREYIHGDKVDEILAMQAGANTYYYHYDDLGSVTEITDDTGAIVENYTYDPFGAPSVTTSTINNRYRFTGREYDEESGLYHYRARAYSPTIGRFMQRDPIGYYDSMNLYQYTLNNPINSSDPTGLNVYAASAGHLYIGITDPTSQSGIRWYDFGPADGAIWGKGRYWPVYGPGQWRSSEQKPAFAIIYDEVKTSSAEDQAYLKHLNSLVENQGQFYSIFTKNCIQAGVDSIKMDNKK